MRSIPKEACSAAALIFSFSSMAHWAHIGRPESFGPLPPYSLLCLPFHWPVSSATWSDSNLAVPSKSSWHFFRILSSSLIWLRISEPLQFSQTLVLPFWDDAFPVKTAAVALPAVRGIITASNGGQARQHITVPVMPAAAVAAVTASDPIISLTLSCSLFPSGRCVFLLLQVVCLVQHLLRNNLDLQQEAWNLLM